MHDPRARLGEVCILLRLAKAACCPQARLLAVCWQSERLEAKVSAPGWPVKSLQAKGLKSSLL